MNKKANGSKVPPNGGWGWFVVLAYALNGVSTVPIFQGFGLIFKDTFPMFGFSGTDGSIIMNTNLAFGMILGLLNGPLLKRFGYRNVATAGSFAYTLGVTLTAFANTFPLLMFSYGILASLGMGVTMSAFSFAVNSYFTTRRGRAMGLALTITGLGPIIMPQVASFLIAYYGFQGTMFIYGACSLHSLIGAALLQPVKWHMKDATDIEEVELISKQQNQAEDNEKNNVEEKESALNLARESSRFQRKRKLTTSSINHDADVASIYGFETPLPRQLSETLSTPSVDNRIDIERMFDLRPSRRPSELVPANFANGNYFHKSIDTVHLGSSFRIFEEFNPELTSRYYSIDDVNQDYQEVEKDALSKEKTGSIAGLGSNSENERKEKFTLVRGLQSIAKFYDLDLLRDPIYVNILIGMGIAIFAEVNFSVLTPFILSELGLTTKQIATVMSLIASIDLIFRCIAPFLGEWLHQPARIMYLTSLILLILSRTSLIFVHGFTGVLIVAIGLGASKGIRSVYMSLVVPSHVPIHRLPYASGIQMVLNGVILMSAGPLLGVIRDSTGSYMPCITVINCVTSVTVALWAIEILIVRKPKSTRLSTTSAAEVLKP